MFDSFPIDLVGGTVLLGLFIAFIIASSELELRELADNIFRLKLGFKETVQGLIKLFLYMLVFTIIFSLVFLLALVLWILFETQILGIPFESKI